MQGAVVNLSNTNVFGSILNTGNAGNCELNRVKSISGNQISLLYRLEKDYDVNGKVQLVRVPEYGNITANGLTCKPWDGTTGGVLIVEASGTLTLQAGADVTGRGFRGGKMVNANGGASHETQYYYPPTRIVPLKKVKESQSCRLIILMGVGEQPTAVGAAMVTMAAATAGSEETVDWSIGMLPEPPHWVQMG